MAYNLEDLQAAVIDDLKDPSFNPSRVTRYLNLGQNAIFNTHMFRFTEKAVRGTLTVGEYAYDQQSDHQATIGGALVDDATGSIFVINDDSYVGHRQFFELFPDPDLQTDGMPSVWTEFGNEVIFNCPVDKAYTFKQRYYRTPTPMANASDVPDAPEAFRELLELYALYRSEKYRGNHDIAATYKQDFEDGLENMVLRFSEVQQAGPVQVTSNRVSVQL